MTGTSPATPAGRRRLSASDLSAEFKHRFSTLHWRHASNEQFVDDVTLDIFYKPHTITLLGIGGAFLVYWAFVTREADSALERAIRGLQVRECTMTCIPPPLEFRIYHAPSYAGYDLYFPVRIAGCVPKWTVHASTPAGLAAGVGHQRAVLDGIGVCTVSELRRYQVLTEILHRRGDNGDEMRRGAKEKLVAIQECADTI